MLRGLWLDRVGSFCEVLTRALCRSFLRLREYLVHQLFIPRESLVLLASILQQRKFRTRNIVVTLGAYHVAISNVVLAGNLPADFLPCAIHLQKSKCATDIQLLSKSSFDPPIRSIKSSLLSLGGTFLAGRRAPACRDDITD